MILTPPCIYTLCGVSLHLPPTRSQFPLIIFSSQWNTTKGTMCQFWAQASRGLACFSPLLEPHAGTHVNKSGLTCWSMAELGRPSWDHRELRSTQATWLSSWPPSDKWTQLRPEEPACWSQSKLQNCEIYNCFKSLTLWVVCFMAKVDCYRNGVWNAAFKKSPRIHGIGFGIRDGWRLENWQVNSEIWENDEEIVTG